MKETFLFVYNAKSGVWSKYLDNLHKIVSPATYSCDLCSLTHGVFSEKKLWRGFRENSALEFVFMCKNDFLKEYSPEGLDFPVILKKEEKGFLVVLEANELASLDSEKELIELLKLKIN
ncbi:GTPase [Aquimarina sp. I32.4]|uniref:GTPase n=1 Tax=Aquimarina sp. I32.4 TaxID=2053903 RepID=UPI000CDF0E67|nr:GTPase [Aquimarina sp. I32.4]